MPLLLHVPVSCFVAIVIIVIACTAMMFYSMLATSTTLSQVPSDSVTPMPKSRLKTFAQWYREALGALHVLAAIGCIVFVAVLEIWNSRRKAARRAAGQQDEDDESGAEEQVDENE